MITRICLGLFVFCVAPLVRGQEPDPTRKEVNAALRKAVTFFHQQVSTEGGYLWRYSADLSLREGEGKATETQVWVQWPGTPAVGQACLSAYRRTGESYLLAAARDAAAALMRGQLVSGGWDYRIEFDAAPRGRHAYRVDQGEGDQPSGRNTTTLDDDNTQSAVRFLMEMDRELNFQDAAIHDAVTYALEHLLDAQYPNGAWPQRFTGPPDPDDFPVVPANYPESWSRTFPNRNYSGFYTFNDNTIADMIETMLQAERVYDDPRYQAAAEEAGGFIILAQMPDPQPAWAQQYDPHMHPAWARKFEPPAITGGESQRVLGVLMNLYKATGKKKYLNPIPKALDYLRRSRLPDGQLARFYELKTNRPLYFTQEYELTYRDDDLPTHYGFMVSCRLDKIRRDYERLVESSWQPPVHKPVSTRPVRDPPQTKLVRSLIESLDSRGAWVEGGQLYRHEGPDSGRIIQSSTFVRNVKALSEYMGRP